LTRPTTAALGFTVTAAALSLTIVNLPGASSAAPLPSSSPVPPATALRTAAMATGDPPTAGLSRLAGLRFDAIPLLWAETSAPKNLFPKSAVHHVRAKVHTHHVRVRTYTVQPGDSFSSIATKFHVNWYNLAADNHLKMYTVLMPGQVLTLPRPGEKAHRPMAMEPGATPAPAKAATTTALVTRSAPAPSQGTVSTSSMGSFESCVISRESGGNPQVMNASGHWGLFQFSESTWVAYGGSPSTFGNASAAAQEQVFDNAMARGGESNWAPYDGC
jgi:LysM repeat protein